MRTAPAPLAALLLLNAGLAHSGAHAAVFRPLPDLPGGDTRTMVWGLSRDGSTAVGSAIDSRGLVAAYWNDSGVHAIDDDASGARPFAAFAASEDGSTIVGGMGPGIRAFAWTTQPGPSGFRTRRLPELAGTTFLNSRAQDIDASGRYAVGYSHAPESTAANPRIQAVMWDLHAVSPAAFGLGYVDPVSLPSSNAVSISGDGGKIVGDGRGVGSIVPFERARAGGSLTPLGIAAGSTTDALAAANHNGSIVVGRLADRGFVFSGEVVMLDPLGPDWTAGATAVSDDGAVIVGTAQTLAFDQSFAVVWDAQGHIRRLDDLMTTEWDLDVEGWTITAATAISGDGQTIAGYGINPGGQTQGFVVTVPAPSAITLLMLSAAAMRMSRRRESR